MHSPVRGQHPKMQEGLKTYTKFIGWDTLTQEKAGIVREYFEGAGMPSKLIAGTTTTELGKLLALCRYGINVAFTREQEQLCKKFDVDYTAAITLFETSRNEGLKKMDMEYLRQPVLYPFIDHIGGHCTVEDMQILLAQVGIALPILRSAYATGRNTKIWGNCNIYDTAQIGKACSIGHGTEIGDKVKIGDKVRIGAMCFIPEGVIIEDNCFIAPKVTFSNDKHPPSDHTKWGKILVKKGAVIGMGAIILPDVTIGEGAVIGAGSVVTKDVPAHEVWYGQAAFSHGKTEDISEESIAH